MKIAIIGGTGTIGSHVLAQLVRTDATVTALARTSVAAAAVRREGAEPILGDLADSDAVKALVADADSILLLTANTPDQLEQEVRVIDAAASSGRATIVKVSVLGATQDAPLALAKAHHAAEEHLRASGIGHVIVRPGWLMQNVVLALDGIIHNDELALPIGSGAVAAVDASDVAAGCCVALTDPTRFIGSDLDLAGGADITGESMADELSAATRRKITFRDLSREDFEKDLVEGDVDRDLANDLGFLYDIVIRNGFLAGPTSSVEEITGTPATSFASFARRNATWFVAQPR